MFVFSDTEREIRQKKNVLINSFLKQYGNDYQSFMEKKFDEIRWCIFVNPRRLREYIQAKSIQLGHELTFTLLKKLGISTSTIQIMEDNRLISKSKSTQSILDGFFPGTGYICDENMNKGIFSFSKNYNDSESFEERASVLKKLKLIKNLEDMDHFVQTKEYKEVDSTIKGLLKMAKKSRDELEKGFVGLEEYIDFLQAQEKSIVTFEQLKFIRECKNYIFENYPNVSLKQFNQPKFFCYISDGEDPLELPLAAGLLEYFLPDYTEILQSSIDSLKKEQICAKRWEYLNSIGVYRGNFNIQDEDLYKKDWYLIPGLKYQLPDMKMVQRLKEMRQVHQDSCMNTLSQMYIINDFKINPAEFSDSMKEMMYFGSSKCSYSCDTYSERGRRMNIFLCPMDAHYRMLDFTIDWNVRHAMECFVKLVIMDNEVPFLEKGSVLEEVKSGISTSFFDAVRKVGEVNIHINAVQTERLSVESTMERYKKGECILISTEEANFEKIAAYTPYVSNFDMVFPKPLQDAMLQSRLQPHSYSMPMYDYVNQKVLSLIDQYIMDDSDFSKEQLREIGKALHTSIASTIAHEESIKEVHSEDLENVKVA